MLGRRNTRLTRTGGVALAALAVVAVLAGVTGNNLLYLMLSVCLALLLVAEAVGQWNVRGLVVTRSLPDEVVATRDARGSWRVENRRTLGASFALSLSEDGHAEVSGRLVMVRPGQSARVPARWRFEQRGAVKLTGVRISSRFPFGFAVREWVMPGPAEVVVFPRPRKTGGAAQDDDSGEAESGRRPTLGAFGDLARIREYVPGDPIGGIHWPTSARRGVPMLVVRDGDGARSTMIRLVEAQGRAWEAEIGRAAGAVDRAAHDGAAVGLELPDETYPPRIGAAWRRTLLEALARLPERP